MRRQIASPADLDRVAKERGPRPSATRACSAATNLSRAWASPRPCPPQAFRLEQGKVSGALQTNQGYAFIAVTEIKASDLPTLAE